MLGTIFDKDIRRTLNTVGSKPVTSIVAPEGSGSSLSLPYAVANNNRIMVVVPSKVEVISLYREMIRRLKNLRRGTKVGYAVEGDVRFTRDSKIIYVTSEFIYLRLISLFKAGKQDFTEPLADVLMIASFHRGNIHSDLAFLLWKQGVTKPNISMPVLVLESTEEVDIDINPKMLGKIITGENIDSYAVDIQYYDKNFGPYDSSLLSSTATMVANLHKAPGTAGHIMVFVAGSREARSISKLLGKMKLEKAAVILANDIMNSGMLAKVNSPSPDVRKIILTTNDVSPVLTLQDVGAVVDTTFVKRNVSSAGGGIKSIVDHAFKSLANQRTSRTGRTADGICYRMITEENFHKLPRKRHREINTLSLHNVVMDLLGAGVNPPTVLPISSDKYDQIIRKLQRLQLINKTRIATEAGILVSSLPLGLETGTIIWRWFQSKPDYSVLVAVVVSTMIDRHSGSYLASYDGVDNRTIADEVEKDKHKKFRGYSDIHTYLKIWKSLTDYLGGLDGRYMEIRDWALRSAAKYNQLREIYFTVVKIMRILTRSRSGRSVAIGRISSTRKAIGHLTPIIQDIYSDKLMTKVRLGEYRSKWGDIYTLDTKYSYNSLQIVPPATIYAILIRKVGGRNVVNCAFATKPENQRMLMPAGFTLGMSEDERATTATAINEEADAADELSRILALVQ